MTMTAAFNKKLIEVALPLPEINDASSYDKMPGIGPHPKGIHHWWARLPLPTARAILFASVVDDPEAHPEKWPTEQEQNAERERLFGILRRMMGKKLHEAPDVYAEARVEMLKYCDGKLPAVFDPFAGGGSIPLEANRMGFDAHAGDLNPIAVLLNKCNLEIAPKWVDCTPVNPDSFKVLSGNQGLSEDIRYYSTLIGQNAQARVSPLYPHATLPQELGGGSAPVIAWIWARTVASPNPAFQGVHVPLCTTYWLSNKMGSEIWLEPIVDGKDWRFEVRSGSPSDRVLIAKGLKAGRAIFTCLLSGDSFGNRYINAEAESGRLGYRMIAVVAQGMRRRVYLPVNRDQELSSETTVPKDLLAEPAPGTFGGTSSGLPYGFNQFFNYFTPRQLRGLKCLTDEIARIGNQIEKDASNAGLSSEDCKKYSAALTTFLALSLDRCVDFNNSLCRWSPSNQKVMQLFGRQSIPMIWDFAETNLFGEGVGSWITCANYVADCVKTIAASSRSVGTADQIDAASGSYPTENFLISTDPPYYDNIGYASLSDFFYVWLRRTIGHQYRELFATVLTPKIPELTATAERHDGDKIAARAHFENGFKATFTALKMCIHRDFPLTVYYAFKQEDKTHDNGQEDSLVDLTTGWETLLEALISSGFQITGTWPVRASQKWRMISLGTNALASYIVLACRPRADDAPQITSNHFRNELTRTLPSALRHLQQGNIAPVDFAQAAIGPGMAVYSRYSRILESSGKTMTVRTALGIVNRTLTEVLSELEDEFDAETRWAIAWFEQNGFDPGDYGDAELLSKAKNTTVSGLVQAGIVISKGGMVRLVAPGELSVDWSPTSEKRLTIWEMTHHLLRLYYFDKVGDEETSELLQKLGNQGGVARELAYRLFNICERKKWSQEAQSYNALVLGWREIARLARDLSTATVQGSLF